MIGFNYSQLFNLVHKSKNFSSFEIPTQYIKNYIILVLSVKYTLSANN